MTQQQKNTALVFAIIAGVLSLPMTWMTIHNPQFQGFGQMFNSAFPGMSLNVTGLNGSFKFLVKAPIWFVVAIPIAACVLQLMPNSKMFAIPPLSEWCASILGVAWIGIAILTSFSERITLGMGALLGLFCAVVSLACLVIPTKEIEVPEFQE